LDKQWVIAIDGPSGSGKSTCAKILADKLELLYIDTGAMYRGLAYWANLKGVPFEDGDILNKFLKEIKLEYGVSDSILIRVDDEDISNKIRQHHISKLASTISQIKSVREFLVDFQRTLATTKVCVMEGRDIGSVVFPYAFCKFFISTATEERARRRLEELQVNGGSNLRLEQIIADIKERDETDRTRDHSPLIQTKDAIFIENGNNLDETIEKLIDIATKKAKQEEIQL